MNELPIPGEPVILFAEECDRVTQHDENQVSVLRIRIALGDLMIIANGVSKYSGGATAARLTVEHLYSHLSALPQEYPADSAIRQATARANSNIMAAAQSAGAAHPEMAATVVLALLQKSGDSVRTWIGHIGDGRAYLIRAGHLHRITTDHTAAQSLLNRGLISAEELEDHHDSAVVTRYLGHQPNVEIEIDQLPLAIGDSLLLCSSGLWQSVREPDIQAAAANPNLTLETAAHHLFEMALAASGIRHTGIEMARLIAPPAIVVPELRQHHPASKWILALLLITVGSLCVLILYVLFNNLGGAK
jgi:serine/threonine protein phosphatase PrpC